MDDSKQVGTDPRGAECWMKPCNSVDCAEFGPKECAGKNSNTTEIRSSDESGTVQADETGSD